jgi:hypothetical protein
MDPFIVCAAFLLLPLAVLLAFLAEAKRDRPDCQDFNQQFPPISDAEFLARCTPGTSPEVALRVRRIVAKQYAVYYEQVYPSTRFIEDLGAD